MISNYNIRVPVKILTCPQTKIEGLLFLINLKSNISCSIIIHKSQLRNSNLKLSTLIKNMDKMSALIQNLIQLFSIINLKSPPNCTLQNKIKIILRSKNNRD